MMLECKELTKWFGSREAVADLTLNLDKGKIYGLLGENGSGKTTWMKMVAGLPSRGAERSSIRGIRWIIQIKGRSRIWRQSRFSMIL